MQQADQRCIWPGLSLLCQARVPSRHAGRPHERQLLARATVQLLDAWLQDYAAGCSGLQVLPSLLTFTPSSYALMRMAAQYRRECKLLMR